VKEPDLRDTPMIEYRLLNEGSSLEGSSLFDLLVAFDEDGKPTPPSLKGSTFRFLARIKTIFDYKDF
ncbi:MAG: hypothetical protein QXY40_06100, partial [Candidatus Methanomethylicia archaeon]